MKKIIISLAALAAISTSAFAERSYDLTDLSSYNASALQQQIIDQQNHVGAGWSTHKVYRKAPLSSDIGEASIYAGNSQDRE